MDSIARLFLPGSESTFETNSEEIARKQKKYKKIRSAFKRLMFFLKDRVEVLRDHVNPNCGVILVHHTKKLSKHQVKEDPFLALSGASALRGFYTTGLILHRPEEDSTQRRLEIELRNGPALPAKLVDKLDGEWVEINPMNERLVRAEVGGTSARLLFPLRGHRRL